jgi:penicillin-insensitive murein endopeptidase
VIGQTTNGCIAGAAELPTEGDGYLVMHLERKRYFGHPSLIRTIRILGERAHNAIGVIQVGDLSQARGGPMPFGHRSHQTGLDADIWFNLDPGLFRNADRWRANIPAPSLLNRAGNGLNRRLWSRQHERLLKLAATIPEVDRIFVNAHIKRELCRTVQGDRSWLQKIRPWFGHDDHFHVRLVCPSDSPECIRQDPVPPGDGCDSSLSWWFQKHPPGPAKPAPPKPPMPEACQALLNGD